MATLRLRSSAWTKRKQFVECTLSDQHAANSAHVVPFRGPGWIAVGDATLSYDPLFGRGIAAALDGGRRGARALTDHARGNASALEEYSRKLEHEFERYRAALHAYYGAERRWPLESFWRRRTPFSKDAAPFSPASAASGSRSSSRRLANTLRSWLEEQPWSRRSKQGGGAGRRASGSLSYRFGLKGLAAPRRRGGPRFRGAALWVISRS